MLQSSAYVFVGEDFEQGQDSPNSENVTTSGSTTDNQN